MATSKTSTTKQSTAAKPATKKTTTAKTTVKTVATAKPKPVATEKPAAPKKAAPKRTKAAPAKSPAIDPEMRYKMVQDAAYYIAEKNGFSGNSMDYWIAAELEIENLLQGTK